MNKILVLTSSYPRFAGDPAGNFIEQLASALADRKKIEFLVVAPAGCEGSLTEQQGLMMVSRFCYMWPRFWQTLAYGSGMAENIRASLWAGFQIPFFAVSSFLACLRRAKEADAIHAHWMLPSGLIAGFVSQITAKPLLVSAHGSDLQMLQQIPWGRWIARFIFKQAESFTVTSEYGRKLLIQILGEDCPGIEKIKVLPMGIHQTEAPPERFTPQGCREVRNGHSIILYLGRLIPTKGVDLLLQALSGMDKVTTLIAGDGSERIKLEKLSKNLKVDAKFLGWVSRGGIRDLLKIADCVVIPSRDAKEGKSEGMPLVLLEALAEGCPIVATAVGGIPEAIRHRQNGYLVTPNDADSIREGIRTVLSDENLRLSLKEAAKKSVTNFDLAQMARRWEMLYEELIQRFSKRQAFDEAS